MRFSLLAGAALLMFGGCASKSALDMFKMDAAHERSVEQLRSGTIIQSFETKAIVSSVYLNPIHPETYKDGEYFVGAFYFEKRILDVRQWDLKSHGYTLTLNNKAPTLFEELKEKDPRRLYIPVQNKWNKYYLIRFDSVTEPSLALRLENNQTGSVVLNYQKVR